MDINLKIGEILNLPSNGKFILCCTEPQVNNFLDKHIINMFIDRELYLYVDNKFFMTIHVCGVEISSSIIDQKNIYLLISDDISSLDNIKNGYLKLTRVPV